PPYSLLSRGIEEELLPFCASEGVGAIVYSPLAHGLLTGKYQQGQEAASGTRAAAGDRALMRLLDEPENFRIVEELQAYAELENMSLPQLALAWVLARKGVAAAIVGASRPEHIRQAVQYADTRLSGAQLDAIERIASRGQAPER
ncbi:aldo/keto reductase, partial [Paenibacillus sepulcri]|nr:aldo/keto reductase [Paenibacillus sepulcri]